MAGNQTLPAAQKVLTNVYSGIRGVDLSSDPINVDVSRSPCMLNLYRDYDEKVGSLKTRNGLTFVRRLLEARPQIVDIADFINLNYWMCDVSQPNAQGVCNKLLALGCYLFFVPDMTRDLAALEDFPDPAPLYNVTLQPWLIEKGEASVVCLTNFLTTPTTLYTYWTYAPPLRVEYDNKLYFYNKEVANISFHGDVGSPFDPTGDLQDELSILWVEKSDKPLTAAEFLATYKKQQMMFAGYGIQWREEEAKFVLNKGQYENSAYIEALAPILFTACDGDGAGQANLPYNICSRLVRIEFSFMATKALIQNGLRLPVEATHVSIRTFLPTPPSGSSACVYEYFDLSPLPVTQTQDGPSSDKRWGDNQAFTAALNRCLDGKDDFLFQATVLAQVAQTAPLRKQLLRATATAAYDERVFFCTEGSGKIQYSVAGNPLYVSDTYTQTDAHGINRTAGMMAFGNYLAVLGRDSALNTAIYLHTPADTGDDLIPRTYPSTYTFTTLGIINERCLLNFNGDALFLSYEGLKQIVSTDLKSAASIAHKSSMIDGQLLPLLRDYADSVQLFTYQHYVCIYVNGNIYLGDTKMLYQNPHTKSVEYEWFVWTGFKVYGTGTSTFSFAQPGHIEQDGAGNLNFYYHTDSWQTHHLPVLFSLTDTTATDHLYVDGTSFAFDVASVLTTRFDNFNAYLNWKDCCHGWQTAGILVDGDDIQVTQSVDPERTMCDYGNFWLQNHAARVRGEIVPVKKTGQHIRYQLTARKFEQLSVGFCSKDPIHFTFATAQAYLRGQIKK